MHLTRRGKRSAFVRAQFAGASADYANPLLRRIWKDFLYRQRRWMSGPGGDLRVTKDPVADLGMEYHYEGIGGWMREWYVYVPEQVKAAAGKAGSVGIRDARLYLRRQKSTAGNSEWYKVADKHGFIVVHPSATPGTDADAATQACDPDNVAAAGMELHAQCAGRTG